MRKMGYTRFNERSWLAWLVKVLVIIISFLLGVVGTSPGVPAKMLDKIFEPFQSQFEGGTGLGLAIVYQIVLAHGARIRLESRPEGGAEFVLEILQAKAAGADFPQGAAALEMSHG